MNKLPQAKVGGWAIEDERKYLERAVTDHGKNMGNYTVNAVAILQTWLATYKTRRWGFRQDESAALYDMATKAEADLKTLQSL